jgi:tRNA(His) 5'-end guanylyltransferase
MNCGNKMKYYEEESKTLIKVPNDRPFLIRLNGRNFINLTQKFKNLENKLIFNVEFKNIMLLTAKDLMYEFKCSTVYTHSDEITLIFNNDAKNECIFGGNIYLEVMYIRK